MSGCLGRKTEMAEDRKSPESWDCLSPASSVYKGRNMEGSLLCLRLCCCCAFSCWWMRSSTFVYKLLLKNPNSRVASGNFPWRECCFVPRSFLPLLQHGLVGFLLHLRLPARDQSQAPGGDRSAVREPALLLRRLGFGRRAPGRIHPRQRLKLPSIRQRRIRRGLEVEQSVGSDSTIRSYFSGFKHISQSADIQCPFHEHPERKPRLLNTLYVHTIKDGDVLKVQNIFLHFLARYHSCVINKIVYKQCLKTVNLQLYVSVPVYHYAFVYET